jgi:hypothetical protein
MKMRAAVPLVTLAISFALPTFAAQNDIAAPPMVQQRDLLGIPDALAVFGKLSGKLDDTFQRWPITDFLSRRERLRLNAIDNAVWSVGEWSGNLQSQTGPVVV